MKYGLKDSKLCCFLSRSPLLERDDLVATRSFTEQIGGVARATREEHERRGQTIRAPATIKQHDEPRHEKTNILVSNLVRHKPGCTAKEDG